MKLNTYSRKSAGFTLVELLVVILITVVLAALSFIGISRMRMMADKVASTRNISQLHIANAGYAVEHNGKYVPVYSFDGDAVSTSEWHKNPEFLTYLLGELPLKSAGKPDVTVALSMLDAVTVRAKKKGYKDLRANYGYVQTPSMPGGTYKSQNASPSYNVHQVPAPARLAAFITGTDYIIAYGSRFRWQGTGAVEGGSNDQKMAYRHNNKALVVYYDGHVGDVSIGDIKAIDKAGGVGNAFWSATAGN